MPYLQAGYFLIASRPYALPGEAALLLPTVSTCINDSFPDSWALSWSGKSDEQLARLQADYGIDAVRLAAIQRWGDAALGQPPAAFGWPNVLSSIEVARSFYHDFLSPLPLRLIGLFLPEDQLEIALATLRPQHPQEGECGLYQMLARQLSEPAAGEVLGFEIMGLEIGGSLHSFYCNHLQQDYHRLGIAFNRHHLIAGADDARRALEFTLDEETHAEPVPWLSFRLREFAL